MERRLSCFSIGAALILLGTVAGMIALMPIVVMVNPRLSDDEQWAVIYLRFVASPGAQVVLSLSLLTGFLGLLTLVHSLFGRFRP